MPHRLYDFSCDESAEEDRCVVRGTVAKVIASAHDLPPSRPLHVPRPHNRVRVKLIRRVYVSWVIPSEASHNSALEDLTHRKHTAFHLRSHLFAVCPLTAPKRGRSHTLGTLSLGYSHGHKPFAMPHSTFRAYSVQGCTDQVSASAGGGQVRCDGGVLGRRMDSHQGGAPQRQGAGEAACT